MNKYKIIDSSTVTIWNGEDEVYHIIKTGFRDDNEFMIVDGGPHDNGNVEYADKQRLFERFGLGVEDVEQGEEKQLFDFFIWFRTFGESHIGLSIEKMISLYLQQKLNSDQNVQECDARKAQ
jgi:hypothetical protein